MKPCSPAAGAPWNIRIATARPRSHSGSACMPRAGGAGATPPAGGSGSPGPGGEVGDDLLGVALGQLGSERQRDGDLVRAATGHELQRRAADVDDVEGRVAAGGGPGQLDEPLSDRVGRCRVDEVDGAFARERHRSRSYPADNRLREGGRSVLVGHEVPLARAAHGTEPAVGDVVERGPGRDPAVGVAVGGVVDEAAGLADPLLHGGGLAHVVWKILAGRPVGSSGGSFDRRGPGGGLNRGGTIPPPRQAATVFVLRGGASALEVLLVQRNPAARFMGGAWVFPGGAVDEGETVDQTARRELQEEAAIALPPAAPLVAFSRWITPAEVKIRFDTWFFVVESPNGAEPTVDGAECVDVRWIRPQQALDELESGRLQLVFRTIKHLEQLAAFPSVAATLETA